MMKRRRLRPKWQKFVLPIALSVAVGMIAFAVFDQQALLSSLETQESELNSQISRLSTERDRLERMIDYAGTDAYVEQIARDVLGWIKDGETRYVAP